MTTPSRPCFTEAEWDALHDALIFIRDLRQHPWERETLGEGKSLTLRSANSALAKL